MNDKLLLENVLILTKSISKLYCDGYIESSNKKVTTLMDNGLTEILSLQQNLYKCMSDNGLYQVNNVKLSEITKTLKKLTQQKN